MLACHGGLDRLGEGRVADEEAKLALQPCIAEQLLGLAATSGVDVRKRTDGVQAERELDGEGFGLAGSQELPGDG